MNREFNNVPVSELNELVNSLGDLNEAFRQKDILILGGSGSLGQLFKVYLLFLNQYRFDKPCRIVSVDNYVGRSKPKEIEDPNLVSIEHDLSVPLGVKVFGYKFDYILNFCGNAAPGSGYGKYPIECMDVSYLGTKFLLELAIQHKASILNMSSSEVVGNVPLSELPSDENVIPKCHPHNPRSCYDLFKLAGIETQSYVFREKYGVDVKVIRPFNVLAHYRQGDSRVVPNFLDKLLKNQKMPVYLPSTQQRTFCFWTDFFDGIIRVLLNGKELVYNIGRAEEMINVLDLARKLEVVSSKPDSIELVETPKLFQYEPQCRQPSIERARKELGYAPKINLDTMLARCYDWAKTHYKY